MGTDRDAVVRCLECLARRVAIVLDSLRTTRASVAPSPDCQAAHDIAVAASSAAAAAWGAYSDLDDIAQVAWEAYWDCESP